MNYTEKYHLPQWEESDRVMRADFNQMCADIEAGIAQAQEMVEVAVLPRCVVGTYIGTKTEIQISVGFRPVAVIIFRPTTSQLESEWIGTVSCFFEDSRSGIVMTDTGFTVQGYGYKYPATNWGNTKFQYIAFR